MGDGSAPDPLPTFLIVGAAKAGTTSLAAWLAAHPDVYVPPEKEVHFFDRSFDRGLDWYRSRFSGATTERAIGEATPEYMAIPEAAERMASALPGARLIAILRNPVDRAYSQYWHQRIDGRERREFADVVREHMRDSSSLQHPRWYLTRGRYMDQLRRLVPRYPREALMVLLLEDLSKDAGSAFRSACGHIGVAGDPVPEVVGTIVNPRATARSGLLRRASAGLRARGAGRIADTMDRVNRAVPEYPPMDPSLHRELTEWFADANRELARWLERDLTGWLPETSGRSGPTPEAR